MKVDVDPSTIRQYTGLTDKNGKKIWENDIVRHKESQCIGAVKWYSEVFNECEVIGNIFDNPELLEVEHE